MAEKAREKRESLTSKPFEEIDEAARAQSDGEAAGALKKAAITAVVGAFAAGLGGATKALLERRSTQPEREADDESEDGEEQGRPAEPDPLDQAEATAEPEQEAKATAEPEQDAKATAEPEQEAKATAEPEQEAKAQASEDEEDDQQEGTDAGEAAQVVRQARQELESLLGSKPESVSGFEHVDGKWSVTLEVVDVRRVPESTDVLSSYEVVLDEERNLVSARRLRRYRRSQVEEA
jgi:outer membrane biosynthesis protein TonB